MCNSSLALLSPFHLTQIKGPSSSLAIYLNKPTEPEKQPHRTWPCGLVTASPTEVRFTGLAWVALFMDGKRRRGVEDEEKESKWESIIFLLHSPLFLSPNSIPFQSPSDHSENASSYYITYVVHQSNRVWSTLSITPKSWCYQTLRLRGIAVTTSGSLGWDREPLGGRERRFPCCPTLFISI